MSELLTLTAIVTAFVGVVAGMLWGIAAMTGGAGDDAQPDHLKRRH